MLHEPSNFAQNAVVEIRGKGLKAKTDQELVDEILQDLQVASEQESEEINFYGYRSLSRLAQNYLSLSKVARDITEGKYEIYLSGSILFTIALGSILVGIETYPSMNNSVTNSLELFVTIVFVVEFILKVLAEGLRPWNYFCGPQYVWNFFDFTVVLFCLVGDQIGVKQGHISSIVRVGTKLVRMARVVKIVKQIPALYVIFKGLIGGLRSVAYIFLLLCLIFYLYAVVGVSFFHRSDPFFFRSIPIAVLALFDAVTFDNWGCNYMITFYGCQQFPNGIYVSRGSNMTDDEWQAVLPIYRCEEPRAYPITGSIYWLSFTVISALVIVSMFIGAVTMGMQHALHEMKEEADEAQRKKTLKKQMEELQMVKLRFHAREMMRNIRNQHSTRNFTANSLWRNFRRHTFFHWSARHLSVDDDVKLAKAEVSIAAVHWALLVRLIPFVCA